MKRRSSNRSYSQPSIYSRTERDVVRRDYKRGFLFFLIFLFATSLVYFLLFSGVFTIKHVETDNLKYADQSIVRELAENYTKKSFLNRNILTVNSKNLSDQIISAGGIKTVKVIKKFPDTLYLKVEERGPSFVWQVIDQKYLVDDTGRIWASFEDKFADSPIVIDVNNVGVKIGQRVVSSQFSKFIEELNQNFNLYAETKITKMEVSETTEEVKVTSEKGWYALFDTTRTAKNQLINLNRILKEAESKNKKLEYIDLRINNRIFYKYL